MSKFLKLSLVSTHYLTENYKKIYLCLVMIGLVKLYRRTINCFPCKIQFIQMNELNTKLTAQLLRLKRERKELINSTQKNIESNHQVYQQKVRRVQDILEKLQVQYHSSQRNIVNPVKPIPQPFTIQPLLQQVRSTGQNQNTNRNSQTQQSKKKLSNYSSSKRKD